MQKKTIDMYFDEYMFYAVNVKSKHTVFNYINDYHSGADRRFILKLFFRFTTLSFNDKGVNNNVTKNSPNKNTYSRNNINRCVAICRP